MNMNVRKENEKLRRKKTGCTNSSRLCYFPGGWQQKYRISGDSIASHGPRPSTKMQNDDGQRAEFGGEEDNAGMIEEVKNFEI